MGEREKLEKKRERERARVCVYLCMRERERKVERDGGRESNTQECKATNAMNGWLVAETDWAKTLASFEAREPPTHRGGG